MSADYFGSYPLEQVKTTSLKKAFERSKKVVSPCTDADALVKTSNFKTLTESGKRLIDEGDLLPSWAHLWIEFAAKLTYENSVEPSPVLITAVPRAIGILS